MKFKKDKGIALIAAIMLIMFVTTAVLGLSVFIVGWYEQIITEEREARCVYNAMAGVNYALYQYRLSSALTNGTLAFPPLDTKNNFALTTVLGSMGYSGAAANLKIIYSATSLSGNDIIGATLTNTSTTTSIILSQMVLYIGSGTKTLSQVRINGSNVWTTSTSISTTPVTINITDVTIPANTTRALDRIRWSAAFGTTSVAYVRFIMSDGSSSPVCTVYPTRASLTIDSIGNSVEMVPNQHRALRAVYEANSVAGGVGNVPYYHELP